MNPECQGGHQQPYGSPGRGSSSFFPVNQPRVPQGEPPRQPLPLQGPRQPPQELLEAHERRVAEIRARTQQLERQREGRSWQRFWGAGEARVGCSNPPRVWLWGPCRAPSPSLSFRAVPAAGDTGGRGTSGPAARAGGARTEPRPAGPGWTGPNNSAQVSPGLRGHSTEPWPCGVLSIKGLVGSLTPHSPISSPGPPSASIPSCHPRGRWRPRPGEGLWAMVAPSGARPSPGDG